MPIRAALNGRVPVRVDHDVEIDQLDPRHDGVRIAHLSDLHVGKMTPPRHVRRAIDIANDADPDIVALTGDYVCFSQRDVEALADQLAGLRARRVLVVLGNHDHWTDGPGVARALEAHGYEVLHNDATRVDIGGAPLHVVGIDDPVTRRHDLDRAFRGVPAQHARIVLCHGPELAPRVAQRGAALILSGHTHGGQIVIRGITDRIVQRIGLRFLGGFYEVEGAQLYVTSGVGTSGLPMRAGPGTQAEVVVHTLRAKA